MASGPPLIVIAGPTGAGKTELAVELAEQLGAEIVSADSQAVYRHFDLGTAKPSPEQLARVAHHLVSIVEPTETFSAARWAALADAAIAEITQRGRRVLVVGGTGLYLRVLLHGLTHAPPDPAVRRALEEEARQVGPEAMHRRLAELDPDAAARLAVADVLRVVRALEIHATTGTPPSQLRAAHAFKPARHPARLFFLDPDREDLEARIAQRTRGMYERGLVAETERLVARGFRDAAPMRSVGYRQALAVVEGRLSAEQAEGETALETRRYAKRQRTWFRREPDTRFVTPPYAALWDEAGAHAPRR
ncbi:MAG: tRNA (adenosine(37)-N6)-dimethylallyltransferase MiaA [Myxococcaceae bacterium]